LSLRVFISRELDQDSPIKNIIEPHQVEIIGESLIKIQPIVLSIFPTADWFFFYSKNGVESFVNQWKEKRESTGKKHPIRWAAIGEGTSEAMNGWGISCEFVGHGETEEIAAQFLTYSKPSESVVFFRAFHSKNSLYHLIAEKRKAEHVAIYDNQLIEKQFPPCDIGIFTSSRNAIAFLQNNPDPGKACIAIGQPTKETLLALNVPEETIHVAEEPSEKAIYEMFLRVLGS